MQNILEWESKQFSYTNMCYKTPATQRGVKNSLIFRELANRSSDKTGMNQGPYSINFGMPKEVSAIHGSPILKSRVTMDLGTESSAFGKVGTFRETEYRKRLPTGESNDEFSNQGKNTWPTKPLSPMADDQKRPRNSILTNNMGIIMSNQVQFATQGLG
jgi:hypothetical protein